MSLMAEGLVGAVLFQGVLLIALQAMCLPEDMLQKYEYRHEMEAAILDTFLYGLAINTDTPKAVADWCDYKVGLAVSLSLSASAGDMEWSCVHVDYGIPLDSNLFTCGFANLSRCVGGDSTDGESSSVRVSKR